MCIRDRTKTDGAGSGTITIQEADGKLSVSSKKPVTVKRVRSIGDTQTVQYDVDQTAGQIVLAQDGSLTMKNGSASVWRILIPICGICGVLAVLVLMRSRRKTVSYTHLDVYKRQAHRGTESGETCVGRFSQRGIFPRKGAGESRIGGTGSRCV